MQRQIASSGSDSDPAYANIDERKRKRMISNRESAKRSRAKKQKLLEDLVNETNQLKSGNSQLMENIDKVSHRYMEVESANDVLRAQAVELTERLRSLNSILHICEEISGFALDIPEILLDPFAGAIADAVPCTAYYGVC
uniref:Uncharacterized protein MANES_05G003300 n=1 Tax=Rhizophora mucronata TaxID=61149 RepID=A0A2P2JUJ3_RHIMU